MSVELESITAGYGANIIVENLNLKVTEKEFLTLLGPSGCGKTTTLNVIAGLLKPRAGRVLLDGEDITNTPPYNRRMSLIFQNYALFPHMNVFDNVRFGLKIRRIDRRESEKRVKDVLEMVKLDGYENRMPTQLSGGEQQRVALARAIVINPKVLLLDEPLSNLDAKLRIHMRTELKKIQKTLGVTAIYVTHDQIEALTMSDKVIVMSKGQILQIGEPKEIYQRPKNKFTADFIGEINLLRSRIDAVTEDYLLISSGPEITGMQVDRRKFLSQPSQGQDVLICIRPEYLSISGTANSAKGSTLSGEVLDVQYMGSSIRYLIQLKNGETIQVKETYSGETMYPVGTKVYAQIQPSLISVLEYEP